MDYIVSGHKYVDDVVSMLMMFYPNEKYTQVDEVGDNFTVVSVLSKNTASAHVFKNGKEITSGACIGQFDDVKEHKRVLKVAILRALKAVKNIDMPWGILTGVRPAKLVSDMWAEGKSDFEIREEMVRKFKVSPDKVSLMFSVASSEQKILKDGKGKVSLYIGIPFCPTRCLYCSFTSYDMKRYNGKMDAYLDALEKEMAHCSKYYQYKKISSIYIGGGTPTSLNEQQLERLLSMVDKYYSRPQEYTVEAGRPDTITREKLRILRHHNVGRISINPQTLNQKTLDLIGRNHTVEMFIDAFKMAREEGFKDINTDIILGLPGEGEEEVTNTLKGLKELGPESITVHTLAVKRASRLKETLGDYTMTDAGLMDRLLGLAAFFTDKMGMHPYYMYRQKNMVGNFENVGYAKEGYECIYNVEIMEEQQTILALGAGGSTKLVNTENAQIERIFNVKSVDDYINRIDEMIQRKEVGIKWL